MKRRDRPELFARLAAGLTWDAEAPFSDVLDAYCDHALTRVVELALGLGRPQAPLTLLSRLDADQRDRLVLDPRLLRQLSLGGKACPDPLIRKLAAAHGGPPGPERAFGRIAYDFEDCRVAARSRRTAMVAAVQRAALRMREVFPIPWAFVESCTGLILFRSDARGFYSSSPERFIGATLLWNTEADGVSTEMLVDALIHEAIHSLLDMDSTLRAKGAGEAVPWMEEAVLWDGTSRLISPWTQAPLSIAIFVHACAVWYGLFTFWSLALATPRSGLKESEMLRLLRRAASGFFAYPERALQRFEPLLAPDILPGIRQMGLRVRETLLEAAA